MNQLVGETPTAENPSHANYPHGHGGPQSPPPNARMIRKASPLAVVEWMREIRGEQWVEYNWVPVVLGEEQAPHASRQDLDSICLPELRWSPNRSNFAVDVSG